MGAKVKAEFFVERWWRSGRRTHVFLGSDDFVTADDGANPIRPMLPLRLFRRKYSPL
jgi:hypothetical protein